MVRIGLGLAALGRPAYINAGRATDLPPGRSVEAMCARAGEVLDAAYALGVRYVDVARSYGLAKQFLRSRTTASRRSPSSWRPPGPRWVTGSTSTTSTRPPRRAGCSATRR